MEDDELLAIVQRERQGSIGFDQDSDLVNEREKALNYYKGDMPDIPSLDNRSKAVSMDVADAIETILPDLMEIFTGGDDVVAFTATSEQDEEAAQQETDYLNHVVFQDNDGFSLIYSAIKDALLTKTGVITWWWDEAKGAQSEDFEGKTAMEVAIAGQSSELKNIKPSKDYDQASDAEPTYDFTAYKKGGRLCIKAVPPEDFTVAKDTVFLAETTYCAMRSRPRLQDLIAQGMDRDKVEDLPLWGAHNDGVTAQARDTVSEQQQGGTGEEGDLRVVEVVAHYVRLLEGDRLQYWRVVTGAEETVLLEKEKVNAPPFSAGTPYIVAHRFYGESVADKLLEIQRIKTALTRMFLDSGYFALNQRMIVDESKAGAFTLSDLMRNEPNMPIRVKGEGAVLPVTGAGLGFDAPGALEYFSTVGEGRTGIVRNAQGLNPDTLHDTAKGALALMSAAQKRVRLIARIFAETLLKDMYLGAHAMLRENATEGQSAKLRGQWVQVDPTKWGNRSAMTIQVGLGAAGREHDIAAMNQLLPVYEQLVTVQGGLGGPLVTADNLYALMKRLLEKLGFKSAEQYITDPKPKDGQPVQAPQPPPDPAMAKVQGELQITAQQAAAKAQNDQARAASDAQIATVRAQNDHTANMAKIASDERLKLRQQDIEAQLRTVQLSADAKLEGADIALDHTRQSVDIGLNHDREMHKIDHPVEQGGETG